MQPPNQQPGPSTNSAENKTCLLCHSTSLFRLKDYTRAGLVKCKNCGFVFTISIPTEDDLRKHYQTYTRDEGISPLTIKRYRELCTQMEAYRKTHNWLDAGCGNGHLLAVAHEEKWNVYGTEFTDEAIEICKKKGISMQQGSINPSNYTPGQFDIISYIEVIEHINTPNQEIEAFATILRKGGALYITTPNFNSLSRKILKEKWNIIEYPEHLSYYTTVTLDRLLTQHGFEKVLLRTTGISPERFFGSIKNKQSVFEQDEKLRQKIEGSFFQNMIKNILNAILNITGSGDTIKALYTKR